jgi:hypothetical protein
VFGDPMNVVYEPVKVVVGMVVVDPVNVVPGSDNVEVVKGGIVAVDRSKPLPTCAYARSRTENDATVGTAKAVPITSFLTKSRRAGARALSGVRFGSSGVTVCRSSF